MLKALALFGALAAQAAMAQTVQFTGSYAQNFNGLPMNGLEAQVLAGRGPHHLALIPGAAGVDGWYIGNFLGSSASTEFRAHDGSLSSSAGRGVISFGVNGSSDRALGALPTSNQVSTFGVVLTNGTAATIDSITVTYSGEQWRRGNVLVANTLTFLYGTTGDISLALTPFSDLDFVSPNLQDFPLEAAIDGNVTGNKTVRTGTLSGLNWAPGTQLSLAWSVNDLSGQDNGQGIDDLSITAGPSGPAACNPADVATAGNPDPQAGPDGFLTGDDFDLFINAFFNELRRTSDNGLIADLVDGDGNLPADGFLTGSDFDFFLGRFFAGC